MFHDFQIVLFDPNYFIFSLGISLNRYIVSEDGKTFYEKKELDFGFLLISLRFSWLFAYDPEQDE